MPAGQITVHGLSKSYRLGTARQRFPTLRDAIVNAASPSAWRERRLRADAARMWALRDVSFSVAPGEIVGVIGPNGAGKSTLLKILSRITEPTSGWAEIHGRMGSLLEVGTGFHPELSGRENVFLNGAVLGMRRAEIQKRFDAIVDFAEVEAFLDTPVKRYSSGMAVRLAFSVAAHLEPEILLVDEVLAVGDLAFQRKCLGKMQDVAGEGRTVLFVSHNMSVVQAFCRRGIVIRHGELEIDGSISDAVSAYLRGLERLGQEDLASRTDRKGWAQSRLCALDVSGASGLPPFTALAGGPLRFTFEATEALRDMQLSFTLVDSLGQTVARFSTANPSEADRSSAPPRRFVCDIDVLPLVPGRYRIDATLWGGGKIQDLIEAVGFVDVAEGVVDGRGFAAHEVEGVVFVSHRWTTPRDGNG